MFNLLWDLYQQGRIADNARDVGEVRTDSQSAQRRINDLERQVDALQLTCTAMWTLVKGHVGLTEDQLTARVRELDLQDGKLDGRMRPDTWPCPSCGRVVSGRRQRCLYCGAAPA